MKSKISVSITALLAIVIGLLTLTTTKGQTVAVDSTFAPNMQEFGTSSGFSAARVSAVQPDGKILVGGVFTVASGLPRSGVARFNADGSADAAFDAGDISTDESILTVENGGTIEAIKIQPDGKILIGGAYQRGTAPSVRRSIERLNADGSPDAAFQPQNLNGFVYDIEIQTDGKIVVGGRFQFSAVNPANGQTVNFRNLARLNVDGTLDFAFAPNGLDGSNSIIIQPDGKIVVANSSQTGLDGDRLVRYNANGTTDAVLASFSGGGAEAMEMQADGKFVVVGYFTHVNGTFQRRVARINADGSLDAAFAPTTGFMNGIAVADVAIQPDGKIVVGGDFHIFNDQTRWRVARINADGSTDATFNTATPIAGIVGDVSVLPDGKIFIGGQLPLPGTDFYNNIAKLNADGSIDSNFNNANVTFEGEGYSIVQQSDGKILVGGLIYYANNLKRRGIARYHADGTIDTGFNPGDNAALVHDIALQPDGKILVVSGGSSVLVYRLNPDGSLDTTFNHPFVPFSASIQARTRATTVVLQPDGKILVGGKLITGSATSPSLSGLARLNADGSRDATFPLVRAVGGVTNVNDIALQPDGKIIIGGDFSNISNQNFSKIARINADGSVDATFSTNAPDPGQPISELELQPDGKVVYAGSFSSVLRVNADGTPDASFNVPVNDWVQALKVQPNGKILVGGYFTSIAGAPRVRIARLNPNGTLDNSLNLPNGANNIVYDFSLQTDGKILVSGAFTRLGNQPRIGAARLVESSRTRFDFDGDGRADIGVFRSGNWYLQNSTIGFTAVNFGLSSDRLVPADYDGDGKFDVAVFRDGFWYILNSADNAFRAAQWGVASRDVPVPADFDGDRKADLAVFRYGSEASSPTFYYILQSSNNEFRAAQMGDGIVSNPVPSDYDGDGRADFAVYSEAGGVWSILQSSNNVLRREAFGAGNFQDRPVRADYDGDGRTDLAVFRRATGIWYLQQSSQGFRAVQFGVDSDGLVPADYDGDGKADIAVWRPSDGIWYLLQSTNGFAAFPFGLSADTPISSR